MCHMSSHQPANRPILPIVLSTREDTLSCTHRIHHVLCRKVLRAHIPVRFSLGWVSFSPLRVTRMLTRNYASQISVNIVCIPFQKINWCISCFVFNFDSEYVVDARLMLTFQNVKHRIRWQCISWRIYQCAGYILLVKLFNTVLRTSSSRFPVQYKWNYALCSDSLY